MNRIGTFLILILVLFCMAMAAGCSKPRVELAVASQPNVNPDHSSRPSPVIVKVYELRNDLAFKQAEFTTLFDTPLQVLGADLIAADEVVFIPGEARRIAYQPNPSTRFVGVVAGFRQMDRALWRVIKPVDPEEENWLAFELNDATIIVVPDKEAEDWDPEKAVRQFQQQLISPQQPVVTESSPAPSSPQGQPGTMTPAQPSQQPGYYTGPYTQYPNQQQTPYWQYPTQPPAPYGQHPNQPASPNMHYPTQPAGTYPQAPAQSATPGAQPAQTPISTALGEAAKEAGATAEQGAKEAITIINPNGVESVSSGPSIAQPNAPTTPAAPGISTPSLPSMRPF